MTTLSRSAIEQLWDTTGGDPAWAATMAGIAEEESGGNVGALNDNPGTGDYSVGLWQINYFGSLAPGRTAEYGPPAVLASDPTANARAAQSLLGDRVAGLSNWANDAVTKAAQRAGGPLSEAQVSAVLGGQGATPATTAQATTASLTSFFSDLNPLHWASDLGTVLGAIAEDIKTWVFVGAFALVGGVMVVMGLKGVTQSATGNDNAGGSDHSARDAAGNAALLAAAA
jgi:hypothetical protein